jgi:hypothetical protein
MVKSTLKILPLNEDICWDRVRLILSDPTGNILKVIFFKSRYSAFEVFYDLNESTIKDNEDLTIKIGKYEYIFNKAEIDEIYDVLRKLICDYIDDTGTVEYEFNGD